MKIRAGFVSNSSSSSFVVTVREYDYRKKDYFYPITEEQEQKLFSLGFKYCDGYSGNIVLDNSDRLAKAKEDFKAVDDINLYYEVICNEEDVYNFLFKRHIPFLGSIHYGDWLWLYDGKSDYYEVIANYPSQFLMHFNYRNKDSENQYFGIKKIVEDIPSYSKVYFDEEKDNINYGFIADKLHESLKKIGTKAKKFFTPEELNKITIFLLNTKKEKAQVKKKRKELSNEG